MMPIIMVIVIFDDMLSVCGYDGHAHNHNAADEDGENDTL